MHKMLIAMWAVAAAILWVSAWSAEPETVSASVTASAAASRDCDACPEMMMIPGGEFTMGSPVGEPERGDDEGLQRRVRVKPLALGKTEVTVAQWRQFTRASGYLTEAERNVLATGCFTWEPEDPAWAWRAGRSWREPGWRQKDNEPVVCVSWVDAQAYVGWLDQQSGVKGWRLPSEAEWEYAARAGSTTGRPWGDDPGMACTYANGTDRTKGRAAAPGPSPTPARMAIGTRRRWATSGQTPGACTTCWAMCGSGCRTATCPMPTLRATVAPTRRADAGAAWCAAVLGTTPLGCCARLRVSGWGR